MQPKELDNIQTLADWIYKQFSAVDPIEVQNISEKPYHFRYCVGEEVQSTDPTSRQIVNRKYEEHTLEPGESMVLMGAAAYIFVDGVARTYVFEQNGAESTADIQMLIEAAKKAIIGKVGYQLQGSKPVTEDRGGSPVGHNPNSIKDDNGALPPATTDEDEAFAGAPNTDDAPEGDGSFSYKDSEYDVISVGNGVRYRRDKQFISKGEYEAAKDANAAAAQA